MCLLFLSLEPSVSFSDPPRGLLCPSLVPWLCTPPLPFFGFQLSSSASWKANNCSAQNLGFHLGGEEQG